jgi:hypothetical protein
MLYIGIFTPFLRSDVYIPSLSGLPDYTGNTLAITPGARM